MRIIIAISVLCSFGFCKTTKNPANNIGKNNIDSVDYSVGYGIFLGSEKIWSRLYNKIKNTQANVFLCGENSIIQVSYMPQFKYIFKIDVFKDTMQNIHCFQIRNKIKTNFFKILLGDNLEEVLKKLKMLNYQIDTSEINSTKVVINRNVKLRTSNFEAEEMPYRCIYNFKNGKLENYMLELKP